MLRSKIESRFKRAKTIVFFWALLALHVLAPGVHAQAPNALRPRPWLRALLLVFLFFLGGAGRVAGQGSRKDDIVFNSRSVPLAGATVRVCVMPASGQPCTPLAQIFSDAALTQALANPTTTDGMGNYFFYAAPGKYEIEFSGPGITTKQIPNVILPSDPTSPSFSSVTSSGAISAFSLNLTGNLTVNGNTTVVGNLAATTLVSPKIGGTVYVDGVVYPFTRAGIQSAINAAGANSTVVLPANQNILLDGTPITVSNSNLAIACGGTGNSGYASTLIQIPASNGDVFQISAPHFSIRNCQFYFTTLSGTRTGAVFNLSNAVPAQYFENLRFVGDASFNAGDIFFASRASSGSGGWTVDKVWILNNWNTAFNIGTISGTIASDHFSHIITSTTASFAVAEILLDGGVDTFVMDNSELFNNAAVSGGAPVVWCRNTNGNPTNPRWVFFDQVLTENHNNNPQTVWATALQLDAVRTFKYQGSYIASSLLGAAIGASASDVNISNSVFANIQQNAITLAAGSNSVTIHGNDFQDVGVAANNTYPVISAAAGTNFFTITSNRLHKFSAANLPSTFFTVPNGSNGQFVIADNILGVSGTDYAAANALSITTSSSQWTVANNTPPELTRIQFGGSNAALNFVAGAATVASIGSTGIVQDALAISNQGTACANGDLAFSASFGSTTAASAVSGTGQSCHWTITSSGTGQAANPTITWTLKTALPSSATACEMRMDGGTGTSTLINQSTQSSTAPVFTFNGTPVTGSTYFVFARCGP